MICQVGDRKITLGDIEAAVKRIEELKQSRNWLLVSPDNRIWKTDRAAVLLNILMIEMDKEVDSQMGDL